LTLDADHDLDGQILHGVRDGDLAAFGRVPELVMVARDTDQEPTVGLDRS
jgi:hypothetical protein